MVLYDGRHFVCENLLRIKRNRRQKPIHKLDIVYMFLMVLPKRKKNKIKEENNQKNKLFARPTQTKWHRLARITKTNIKK